MKFSTKEEVMNEFVEIEPLSMNDFHKVRETLTRIGVATKKEDIKTLYQSVHVFQKQGKFYLVHFKCMFAFDGRFESTEYTEEDKQRFLSIVNLMTTWGLIKPLSEVSKPEFPVSVTVISFNEKFSWVLKPKYAIGRYVGTKNGL